MELNTILNKKNKKIVLVIGVIALIFCIFQFGRQIGGLVFHLLN